MLMKFPVSIICFTDGADINPCAFWGKASKPFFLVGLNQLCKGCHSVENFPAG